MMLGGLPLFLVLLLLFVAAVLWFRGRDLRLESGLPEGNVIYTDAETWYANAQVLHAADVRLVGKPDYLVEQANGTIIPVELKSSPAPTEPYEGHILQLAAYCLLVESNYRQRPPYGILQYADQAFAVDYTDDLRQDLLVLLDEMRRVGREDDAPRDHDDWFRCAGCGVREQCDQRLA